MDQERRKFDKYDLNFPFFFNLNTFDQPKPWIKRRFQPTSVCQKKHVWYFHQDQEHSVSTWDTIFAFRIWSLTYFSSKRNMKKIEQFFYYYLVMYTNLKIGVEMFYFVPNGYPLYCAQSYTVNSPKIGLNVLDTRYVLG